MKFLDAQILRNYSWNPIPHSRETWLDESPKVLIRRNIRLAELQTSRNLIERKLEPEIIWLVEVRASRNLIGRELERSLKKKVSYETIDDSREDTEPFKVSFVYR
jgi:hypothetical protein